MVIYIYDDDPLPRLRRPRRSPAQVRVLIAAIALLADLALATALVCRRTDIAAVGTLLLLVAAVGCVKLFEDNRRDR